jgi:hypothetical protein
MQLRSPASGGPFPDKERREESRTVVYVPFILVRVILTGSLYMSKAATKPLQIFPLG